jgi:hypothetical protein
MIIINNQNYLVCNSYIIRIKKIYLIVITALVKFMTTNKETSKALGVN